MSLSRPEHIDQTHVPSPHKPHLDTQTPLRALSAMFVRFTVPSMTTYAESHSPGQAKVWPSQSHDWQLGLRFWKAGAASGQCQGTPLPTPFHQVPLPCTAFRCQTHTARHSPTSDHIAHTMDFTALRCTYIHIYYIPMFLDLTYVWQLTWWLGTV